MKEMNNSVENAKTTRIQIHKKTTKLEKEVIEIVNSNMSVREKLTALKGLSLYGRPGSAMASEIINDYYKRIRMKKEMLANNKTIDKRRDKYSLENTWFNTLRQVVLSGSRIESLMYYFPYEESRVFYGELSSFNTYTSECSYYDIKAAYRKFGKITGKYWVRWRKDIKPDVDRYEKENNSFQKNTELKSMNRIMNTRMGKQRTKTSSMRTNIIHVSSETLC